MGNRALGLAGFRGFVSTGVQELSRLSIWGWCSALHTSRKWMPFQQFSSADRPGGEAALAATTIRFGKSSCRGCPRMTAIRAAATTSSQLLHRLHRQAHHTDQARTRTIGTKSYRRSRTAKSREAVLLSVGIRECHGGKQHIA